MIRDERGILGFGILRLAFGLALIAAIAYEAGAVGFARAQAGDVAQLAAHAAANALRDGGTREAAVNAATQALAERDPNARLVVRSVTFSAGGEVTLTIVKKARTLLIQHIDFLEGFHTARATATGGPGRI